MSDPILAVPIATPEPFYSFHIFLFPFEWHSGDNPAATLEEKTSLGQIERIMSQSGHWERRGSWLDPEALVHYNEANYFYDFVRPVLYDTGKPDSFQRHYYHIAASQGGLSYVIQCKNGPTYKLDIDDIVVSFYDTGVGLLAFHLYNRESAHSAPDDILRINQFGRRLYPPFYGTDTDQLGKQAFFEDKNWSRGLDTVQGLELAQSIRLEAHGQPWIKEDYTDWRIRATLDQSPGLIRQLLPAPLTQLISLSPVLDDRMFVVCWYGNDQLVEQVQGENKSNDYSKNDWWYRYIFVDGGGKTCQNDEMSADLLNKHTNARWSKWGTFYGVSRYSLVCLTQTFSKESFSKVISSHVQTMYYKIALLGLVQRACLLRFSSEVTDISQMANGDRKVASKVSSLYRQYLRFVNKIFFREVTAQEQGIEIYDLLQQHMRLSDHVKDLELEIQELHQYADLLEEKRRNDRLDILTYIGALFVVPSFIGTYYSIADVKLKEDWMEIPFLLLLALSGGTAYALVHSRKQWRWVWGFVLLLLMAYVLFIYPNNIAK
jgi:hypothetical protein